MLRHETLLLEKILAVSSTSEKNYEYIQDVPKFSSEEKIVMPPYDEMPLK
jgi:hypothetical protein